MTGRRIGMHVVEEVWLPKRDPKLATYLAHFTPPPQRFPPPPPPPVYRVAESADPSLLL